MQTIRRLTLIAGLAAGSGPALADTQNGPDPYAAGFGFDRPQEAAWGGWIRGTAGTLYAEWDNFVDASYGTASDRTAAPDLGHSGASDAYLSWNNGTFRAGSGNLYNFSGPESFQIQLTGAAGGGPLRVVLQTEGWGTPIDPASVTLNGLAPVFSTTTYTDPNFNSSFGTVELIQRLYYFDLDSAPSSYQLAFGSGDPHLALAQVAVDIGPRAAPVPLPAAVWLLGSALSGLVLIGRREERRAAA